ncbi:hypothetical protein BT96DRAFT_918391 [Gymnopus androsaceus JB14]|uniref:Uncharacterized protein n=1 Tax=Gymnopus androsaceus JB14 TaxID=1447944 RepID=A0A6A4HZR1_9AGAR|nr:hypothetical protein BT96DRAFT_918391 [Gymnopus androsaceus JB14]
MVTATHMTHTVHPYYMVTVRIPIIASKLQSQSLSFTMNSSTCLQLTEPKTQKLAL